MLRLPIAYTSSLLPGLILGLVLFCSDALAVSGVVFCAEDSGIRNNDANARMAAETKQRHLIFVLNICS